MTPAQRARNEANRQHRPTFPAPGITNCTCGKRTVKTYAGWKRHANREVQRAADAVLNQRLDTALPSR